LRVRNSMISLRRGQIVLSRPLIEASFPFCIFQWSCRDAGTHSLLVHPSFTSLQSLSLPIGQRYQRHGTALVSKVGESPDFLGCRDFRTGDDMRRIHWRSTARTGNLVVREFQEEYLCRIAMIVDTFVAPDPFWRRIIGSPVSHDEFESAISLTAALAEYLARGDYVVDIFAAGPDIYHFQGGRSLGYFENILDILACLEPNRGEPVRTLSPAVLDEVSGIGCAVAVLLKWDESRRQLIESMAKEGVAVKIILIASKKPTDLPEAASVLSAEDIFSGRVKAL